MWIWCVGGESVNEWVVSFLLLLPTPLVVVVESAEGRGRGGWAGLRGAWAASRRPYGKPIGTDTGPLLSHGDPIETPQGHPPGSAPP